MSWRHRQNKVGLFNILQCQWFRLMSRDIRVPYFRRFDCVCRRRKTYRGASSRRTNRNIGDTFIFNQFSQGPLGHWRATCIAGANKHNIEHSIIFYPNISSISVEEIAPCLKILVSSLQHSTTVEVNEFRRPESRYNLILFPKS